MADLLQRIKNGRYLGCYQEVISELYGKYCALEGLLENYNTKWCVRVGKFFFPKNLSDAWILELLDVFSLENEKPSLLLFRQLLDIIQDTVADFADEQKKIIKKRLDLSILKASYVEEDAPSLPPPVLIKMSHVSPPKKGEKHILRQIEEEDVCYVGKDYKAFKSELQVHVPPFVLLGGTPRRRGRRQIGKANPRFGRGRGRSNRRRAGFGDKWNRKKTVTIREDSNLLYVGKGIGFPRMYTTTVSAFDTALTRTRAVNPMMNFDYRAAIVNPVTSGASVISGDFMRSAYGYYRVTGFSYDVTFTALEAFPVTIILYPYGPFNIPTFTAVNTATLAEIQSMISQRYTKIISLGALTGGSNVIRARGSFTMDKILGETGVEWRADDNFVSQVAGAPTNRIGLQIGAYSDTGANFVGGIGVKMEFKTRVECFSLLIN